MGATLLTGSAYAVSAALIVYAQESGITPDDLRFTLVIAWAVAGLLLALVSLIIRRSE